MKGTVCFILNNGRRVVKADDGTFHFISACDYPCGTKGTITVVQVKNLTVSTFKAD